jgi:hypothetical protein
MTQKNLRTALHRAHVSYKDEVAKTIEDQPELSYERIAVKYGMSGSWVYRVAKERGLRRDADQQSGEESHD